MFEWWKGTIVLSMKLFPPVLARAREPEHIRDDFENKVEAHLESFLCFLLSFYMHNSVIIIVS